MSSAIEATRKNTLLALSESAIEQAASERLGVDFVLAVSNECLPVEHLTRGEAARFSGMISHKRRNEYLRGRNALKMLFEQLGEACDRSGITFPNPRISLTHSGNLAIAVAVRSPATRGTGIDLEIDRIPRRESARFFLTSRELEWVNQLEESNRPIELLSLWTLKEALFKADPQNQNRWLADYEIEIPSAAVGSAVAKDDETVEFKYCCFKLEEGALAMAVLLRRDQND